MPNISSANFVGDAGAAVGTFGAEVSLFLNDNHNSVTCNHSKRKH